MDIVIMVGTHNFCPNYHYIHISLRISIITITITVVIAYKNIVGSREKCSYNRYVLITDIYDL